MAAATIGKLTIGTASFEVVINDLLYEPVECIVNAANGGLSHGGGVAAAILKQPGAGSTWNASYWSAPAVAFPSAERS